MLKINLPTKITLFRLFMIPFVVLLYYFHVMFKGIYLDVFICLVIVLEITDFLDGYISRKLNQVTDLGKLLDPLTDTLLHLTILLCFTLPPVKIPLIYIFPIIYADFIKAYIRIFNATNAYVMQARISGKTKALLTGAVILWYAISMRFELEITYIPIALVSLISTISMIDYLYVTRKNMVLKK